LKATGNEEATERADNYGKMLCGTTKKEGGAYEIWKKERLALHPSFSLTGCP
jgi:hypothetical protein